jgi:hypothetical protein
MQKIFSCRVTNFRDKSVKKLLDNQICFVNKLGHDVVYEHFASILSAAKKTAKDAKGLLEEFETVLTAGREKGVDDRDTEARAKNVVRSDPRKRKIVTDSNKGRKSPRKEAEDTEDGTSSRRRETKPTLGSKMDIFLSLKNNKPKNKAASGPAESK